MSKTNLHKEKAKCKHGEYGDEFNDFPFKVKKYYDRHCGSREDHLEKVHKKDKEDKKKFDQIKHEIL